MTFVNHAFQKRELNFRSELSTLLQLILNYIYLNLCIEVMSFLRTSKYLKIEMHTLIRETIYLILIINFNNKRNMHLLQT